MNLTWKFSKDYGQRGLPIRASTGVVCVLTFRPGKDGDTFLNFDIRDEADFVRLTKFPRLNMLIGADVRCLTDESAVSANAGGSVQAVLCSTSPDWSGY